MKFKKTAAFIMALSMMAGAGSMVPASAAEFQLGDINMDTRVDILDIIMLSKAIMGKEKLSEEANKLADVDQDSEIDSRDILLVLKRIVGLIDEFPKVQPSITDDGKMLSIVSWNDSDLKNMIQVFKEDYPDIKVKYINCGADSGGGAQENYATFLNSGEDVDLFIAEAGWVLQYINDDDYSVPLSELDITEEDYAGAYDYTVSVGKDNNGVLKAASWQAAPGGYCYNADLAEQYLGITSPEEMQERISGWDKFYELSQELSAAMKAEGRERDDYVTIAASLDDMWQCYFSSLSAPWVVNGNLNTEPARIFTEAIQKYVYNGTIDLDVAKWGPADWMVNGKEGKTLGYFFSSWCLTEHNQLEEICGADGNWRLVEGPQQYYWGGSWLCVSPNCNNKTFAEKFVRYFTIDEESMRKYALRSGDFVNNRSIMEELANSDYTNPLLGGQNQFAILKDVADQIVMDNLTPYNEALKTCLKTVLHSGPMYDALWDPEVTSDSVIESFILEVKDDFPELFSSPEG